MGYLILGIAENPTLTTHQDIHAFRGLIFREGEEKNGTRAVEHGQRTDGVLRQISTALSPSSFT